MLFNNDSYYDIPDVDFVHVDDHYREIDVLEDEVKELKEVIQDIEIDNQVMFTDLKKVLEDVNNGNFNQAKEDLESLIRIYQISLNIAERYKNNA
jgi:CHASE3 domain sensor protein